MKFNPKAVNNMTYKKGDRVSAVRTFNGEQIDGIFQGFHYPTPKMKEKGVMHAIVQTQDGKRYDVYPYTMQKID